MKNSPADIEVTTDEFRMARRAYITHLAFRHAMGWLMAFCVLVLAGIVCGIVMDLRLLILALMLLLIILPGLMFFLYIRHGMQPVSCLNLLPHRITFLPGELLVDCRIEAVKDKYADESEIVEKKGEERHSITNIPLDDIKGYSADSDGITIDLSEPSGAFLRIPYGAFRCGDDLKIAVEMLRNSRK